MRFIKNNASAELTGKQQKRLEEIRKYRKAERKRLVQEKNNKLAEMQERERQQKLKWQLEKKEKRQIELKQKKEGQKAYYHDVYVNLLKLLESDPKLINPDHLNKFSDEEKKNILEKYYSKVYFQAMRVEYLEPGEVYCPKDHQILFRADTVFSNKLRKGVLCCQKCHTIYENNKIGRTIDFTKDGEYLYIVRNDIKCISKNHRIVPAQGWVSDVWFNAKLINIHYCFDCGRYYITLDEYKAVKKNYHYRLLGNFKLAEEGILAVSFGSRESKLRACGYTVSQNIGLSERERHNVLRFIVDRNILSKKTVQSYLSYFKSIAKNRENMDIAVKKWDNDLTRISAYEVGKNPPVEIKGIKFV